uniref:Uncharacterized protein n=1 Tax=viral metagenome TaxID=1070528 RepID=A0A6M3IH55_9ZZZZ
MRFTQRFTQDDIERYVRKHGGRLRAIVQGSAAVPAAHLEPPACHEQVATHARAPLAPPVRVHVHSVRRRLADSDGVSVKAVLDGLVVAGLLADDRPEIVAQVSQSQERGAPERTIVAITHVSES